MERGRIKRHPVPYLPPVDPILDAVESKSGTKNFKVSLPDGTIVYHAVYDTGTNKALMIHVQEDMNFCNRKGFYKSYKKVKTNFEDCPSRFNTNQQKLNKANADPTTTPERKKALEKSQELATTAVDLAEKTIPKRGKQFFSF